MYLTKSKPMFWLFFSLTLFNTPTPVVPNIYFPATYNVLHYKNQSNVYAKDDLYRKYMKVANV